MKKMLAILKSKLPSISAVIVLLLVWDCLVRFQVVAVFLLPFPNQVFQVMFDERLSFQQALYSTGKNSFLGYIMALFAGLILAFMFSRFELLKRAVFPFTSFFQTVPVIAVAPLLIIWFGYGDPTVIACAVIVSFFPILANAFMGFSIRNPELEEMLWIYHVPQSRRFILLQLPLAIPSILSGLRVAAGLSVVGAIVGEFIAGGGLGGLIDSARTQQRVDMVFASLILSSLLGWFFIFIIDCLERSLLRWRPFYKKHSYN